MNRIHEINYFKTVVILVIASLIVHFQANAQSDNTLPSDGLNIYQTFVKLFERSGLTYEHVLQNKEIIALLREKKISLDSLKKYYDLENINTNFGEKTEEGDLGGLVLLAKAYSDSIVVRWGPSTPLLWEKAIKRGYILNRVTMQPPNESGLMFPDTSSTSVIRISDSLSPIKAWGIERIKNQINDADSLAMIATECMYGTSFETGLDFGASDILDREKEREMRFGIALLMADRSSKAADISGLRFVDKNVVPGQSYTYTITPVGNPNVFQYCTVTNDPAENEKIIGLNLIENDGYLDIYWPKSINLFSAYIIERSEDGFNWEKRGKQPIVFLNLDNDEYDPSTSQSINPPSSTEQKYNVHNDYIIRDTIENGKNYQYRIKGLTSFADYTEFTYIKGKSIDLTPPPSPSIVTNGADKKTSIADIEWKLDGTPDEMNDLAGFTVWEANHPDSAFTQIADLLPRDVRKYTTKPLNTMESHYYKVQAHDKSGNVSSSFPTYIHVVDDEPPAPPIELKYIINDTTGVVTLYWKANTEPDLVGYRVYFANRPDREFTQITKEPIFQNIYLDTIALVTLTEKIYYKVQAVDNSHNRSQFSKMLAVNRPDNVPPITPIFEDSEISDKAVILHWRPSGSKDVVKQFLYRRVNESKEEWKLLATLDNPSINFWIDTTGKEETIYDYTIRVMDDANHYSEYAFPIKARRWFDNIIPPVTGVTATFNDQLKNVNLRWSYRPIKNELLDGVDYVFYVYKSLNNRPLTKYKILKSNELTFTDSKINQESLTQYAIKVVYKNGKAGKMSEVANVTIKNK